MKRLYTILFVLVVAIAQAQIINFPDANFKAALLLSGPNVNYCQDIAGANIAIDTNQDNEIQFSEAMTVDRLNLNNLGIADLSGLEHFQNLTKLFCAHNNLTSLDVSLLSQLTYLACTNNQLILLNVRNLPALASVMCGHNLLTTLDVSGAPVNEGFDCRSNQLQSLFLKNGTTPQFMFVIQDNPGLQYICADESEVDYVKTHVDAFGYNCTVNSYCSFSPGGEFYNLQGTVRADSNADGCDATDLAIPFVKLNVSNGVATGDVRSDQNGNFNLPLQAGSYTITPSIENPSYFNIFPIMAAVNFPAQGNPLFQDFCVIPNGLHNDLEVIIIPKTIARPGFESRYTILYKNKGTTTQSGMVSFNFPGAQMQLLSSTVPITSETFNTINWSFENLVTYESREITVVLQANTPAQIPPVVAGEYLGFGADVTPIANDEYPLDNHAELKQLVVNSFDPNDKTCLEGASITPEMAGKYVHYLIRFENTGTAPAENIVVKDMIDTSKFDVDSLIPLNGSHEFVTRTSGNKVEFIFENINLPFDDANNDGYVAFKIKTKPTLVLGDTFSNTASIYFDYNFPIVTEPAVTVIAVLAKQDFVFDSYFRIYPNPASGILKIESKQNIEVQSISIYNTLGQVVLVVPNAKATKVVDVSGLQTGNYFIKIHTDKGTSNAKFIKN